MNISGVNNVHFGNSAVYDKVKKGEVALMYLPADEQRQVIYEAIEENNKVMVKNQLQLLNFVHDCFMALSKNNQDLFARIRRIEDGYDKARLNILS